MKLTACSYLLKNLQELEKLAGHIIAIRSELNAAHDEGIYKLNGDENYKKLTRQFTNKFTRIFNAGYKKIVTDVRLCNKNGKKAKYNELIDLMGKLADFQAKKLQFAEMEASVKRGNGKRLYWS